MFQDKNGRSANPPSIFQRSNKPRIGTVRVYWMLNLLVQMYEKKTIMFSIALWYEKKN